MVIKKIKGIRPKRKIYKELKNTIMKLESKIVKYGLASLIIIGFFTLMVLLIRFQVPTENKDMLNMVIGALLGAFATIVGYFFGSSQGSSEKTEMMNKKTE